MSDLKLARNLAGLALLALLAPVARTQQTRPVVRPVEKLSIEAVSVDWNALVQAQASFLDLAPSLEASRTLETPFPELDAGAPLAPHALPVQLPGGSEALGPCPGLVTEPPLGKSFDSQADVTDGLGFSYIPPDVAGSVGPHHLMAMLNNKVLIQDRLGGTVANVDLSAFWSPLGGSALTYPRVIFDALSGRWLATARSGSTGAGATAILFAISDTDSPLAGWSYYSILSDPLASSFADWTMPGVNGTWVAISANMFNLAGTTFLGAKLWAIDMATALVPGGPLTVSVFPTGFPTALTGGNAGSSSFQVARTYDASTTSLYLVSNSFSSGGTNILQTFEVTGTGPAPAVSGIPGTALISATSGMAFVTTTYSNTQRTMPQVGDARFISPFSVRVAGVAVRNGKLWITHNGGTPGPASNATPTQTSVCWYQLDPALMPNPIVQSGQVALGVTGSVCAMPSVAVNCAEDVVIGFSNGDATRNPECSYVFRLGSDPLGTVSPIRLLKAGDSSYWKNFGVGTTAQWGRYSSSAVDPLDDQTLWTLQEYAALRVGPADDDSRWGTRWGRLGECGNPTITDEPDALDLCLGDPASFSVAATPFEPPIAYQWRKDGTPIPGATSDSYSIGATVASDAGTYDVLVEDGCGATLSLPAVLAFGGATITTQPVTQYVALGDPASFSVVASGAGTLTYQWLHNGDPILLANSDTYSIAAVTAGDYGAYACVVTDECGPVTSDTAGLLTPAAQKAKQAEFDLHIFKSPSAAAACTGDAATFEVVAYPQGVTYVWRKDGVALVPAQTGPTLTIAPVSTADAGSYDVVVSLGSRSRTSAAAVLTVGDVPLITVQPGPATRTVNPGITVEYSVTATGFGNLTYQWRQRPFIPFAPFIDVPGATSPTLLLENIDGSDAGSYKCVVTDECGSVTSNTVRLRIL